MTIIGIVRHGMTDWNKARRLQGQTNVPLNEIGRQQAKAVAKRLLEEDWDIVISSHLSRAYDTGNAIAQTLNIPLLVDERLQEKGFGDCEGTTEEDRLKQFGPSWKELNLGIESDAEIRNRSVTCIEEYCALHPDKKILFVSHGATINQVVKVLLQDESFDQSFRNTSLSIFEKENENWDCQLMNCAKHLDGERV
ncbi:putative phosphoglycerate mutase [Salirhabdus euzebyi]|uniref:Putative phosphoglycerate mutase n=1 Tax=Salirhabdus euzebyi TaxID=394506 RepID=A0A841Q4M3_9BACI|nr:histidine phosphatase family protein [Salirhabdus euzebyi]MBB6453338.1 putative phosphoglycerate mutase [Salirhabdus euzebyi]